MRSAVFFSCLLVLSARAPAQSTLTLATVFPFEAQQLKSPYLEALWKYQPSPLTVSALLTPQGWAEIKLSFAYKTSMLEANAKAEFTPQELRVAESKWKLTLKDWLVGEGDLQMSAGRFKSSSVKLRLGPSALNISSSAKLIPTGLADERITLNFSRALAQGDLSGSTSFDGKGFREQTLTASGSLADEWNLSMTSTLTRQGLISQAFELGLSWDLWNVSTSFTVTSRGLTSESISLDGMLAGLLVQVSLEFSGLEWAGLQAMAFGSLGPLSLNLMVMLSPDSLQMVNLDLTVPLGSWQTQAMLDLLWTDLSDIDFRTEVSVSGRVWGFGVESKFYAKLCDSFNISFSVKRTVLHWDGALNLEFSGASFTGGSFSLARNWRF